MKEIDIELINVIKNRTPKGVNVVDFITDILPMSKEAAYRRLRGDISFTLDEVVCLCGQLRISLDHLLELKHQNKYAFNVIPMSLSDPLEEYYKMMLNSVNRISELKLGIDCFSISAQNTLPYQFAYKFDQVSKLKLFKWLYNANPKVPQKKLKNLIVPQKIKQVQKNYTSLNQNIPSSIILDDMTFSHYVHDIQLFSHLGIISEEEIEVLKKESLELINDMEKIAAAGAFDSGAKANIYVSHTFFDATYIYIQNDTSQLSSIHYGLAHLVCLDDIVCNNQRLWIESLIRYSTLISSSGEFVRAQFFKKQRDVVNSL